VAVKEVNLLGEPEEESSQKITELEAERGEGHPGGNDPVL
jgi:hypothetical protein